jgi:heat shock protein HslJ
MMNGNQHTNPDEKPSGNKEKRMKKSFYMSGMLAIITALALGACATAVPQPAQPQPSEPAKTEEAPVEKTLYVGPSLVDCTGVAPQKCMSVMDDPAAGYQLFYGNIDGFDYEEGYEYELVVRIEKVENPPADASNLKYTLVNIVSKTPAKPTANPEASMPTQIYKLDWYLNDQGEKTAVLPGTEITLTFSDGRISGNSGCNQYGGSVEVNANSIKVGSLMSTMMACEEKIMGQESAYQAALGEAATFEATSETLTMANAQGQMILSFSTLQPAPLVGSMWTLTSYNNGKDALVSVLNGTVISASFSEDGRLSGSAGCNNYTTTYELSDDQMSIGPAATTRKFCGETGVMEQETAYLQALEQIASYKIEGDVLTLYDAAGTRYLIYTASKPVDLSSNTWNLIGYNNGKEAFVSVILDTTITASFGTDGKLSGLAGCNTYNADYTLDGEKISIGPAMTTRMFCAGEGVMEQEMAYLQALEKAATYKIEGEALTLFDAAGLRMAQYQAEGAGQ